MEGSPFIDDYIATSEQVTWGCVISISTYVHGMEQVLILTTCRPPISGGGLPYQVLWYLSWRLGCSHELQASDNTEGQLPEAALSAGKWCQVRRSWTQQGLQSHQYSGKLNYLVKDGEL